MNPIIVCFVALSLFAPASFATTSDNSTSSRTNYTFPGSGLGASTPSGAFGKLPTGTLTYSAETPQPNIDTSKIIAANPTVPYSTLGGSASTGAFDKFQPGVTYDKTPDSSVDTSKIIAANPTGPYSTLGGSTATGSFDKFQPGTVTYDKTPDSSFDTSKISAANPTLSGSVFGSGSTYAGGSDKYIADLKTKSTRVCRTVKTQKDATTLINKAQDDATKLQNIVLWYNRLSSPQRLLISQKYGGADEHMLFLITDLDNLSTQHKKILDPKNPGPYEVCRIDIEVYKPFINTLATLSKQTGEASATNPAIQNRKDPKREQMAAQQTTLPAPSQPSMSPMEAIRAAAQKNDMGAFQHLINVYKPRGLDLSSLNLTKIPNVLTTASSVRLEIESLNLANNKLTSLQGLENGLPGLRNLNIGNNKIMSLEGIGNLKKLVTLYAANNYLNEYTAAISPGSQWQYLTNLPSTVEDLVLDNNLFSDVLLKFNLPNLKRLSLSNNPEIKRVCVKNASAKNFPYDTVANLSTLQQLELLGTSLDQDSMNCLKTAAAMRANLGKPINVIPKGLVAQTP